MNLLKPDPKQRLWLSRGLIFLVLFLNIQAAVLFWFFPERFAPGFELGGRVGATVIQAVGVLFLMWNIPYGFACVHPIRFRISLIEAVLMQGAGLAGETLIWRGLPASYPVLAQSLQRFILFDALGLVLLLAALGFVLPVPKKPAHPPTS